MNKLLSIIVPVYQTKEYLKQCVDSILNQKYQNIEIILVDDGSTDGSAQLCDELAKTHNRVSVLHRENQGPYQARKLGVANSSGDLVTFVDSDDWLEEDVYQDLMSVYEKSNPDLMAFAYRCNQDGDCSETSYSEGLYCRKDIEDKILPEMMFDIQAGGRKLNPSVCCKIFKKGLYEKVTKDVDARITLGEDAIVTYPAMCIAESIYISNKPYYHYRVNQTSCTHVFSLDRVEEVKLFQKNITALLAEYGPDFNFKLQIDCYVRTFLEMMIFNWYGIHRSAAMYAFPYRQIKPNARVQLYGAGEVGKSYFCSLKQSQYAEIVGWYDKNATSESSYGGVKISPPEDILQEIADIIIIAIRDLKSAEAIRESLISLGVDEKKIFWEKPINNI